MRLPSVSALLSLAAAPALSLSTEDPVRGLSSVRDRAAWAQFVEYAVDYRKDYRGAPNDDQWVQHRFRAFRTNLDRIDAHNAQFAAGEVSFELGVNALADLTDAEYRSLLTYHVAPHRPSPSHEVAEEEEASDDPVPETFDWRDHDAVAPVKNQGQCGSCWAFSAVAAMEGAYAIATGQLASFSEQEIVDCTRNGTETCNTGGEMQDAFVEIIENHHGAIEPEKAYPYTAQSKGVCHADDSKAVGHFVGYKNVTSGDENALKQAVATKGVMAVAIDASSFTFQLYRHGVYNWKLCKNKPDDLDHGVAVVGYGTLKTKPFWLVKNSWGEGWGMHGYIMMSRDQKNQCGVATDASYPIMDKKHASINNQGMVATMREQLDEVASIM